MVQLWQSVQAAPMVQLAAAGASRSTRPTPLVDRQFSPTASTTSSSTMARYRPIATLATKPIARRTATGDMELACFRPRVRSHLAAGGTPSRSAIGGTDSCATTTTAPPLITTRPQTTT